MKNMKSIEVSDNSMDRTGACSVHNKNPANRLFFCFIVLLMDVPIIILGFFNSTMIRLDITEKISHQSFATYEF